MDASLRPKTNNNFTSEVYWRFLTQTSPSPIVWHPISGPNPKLNGRDFPERIALMMKKSKRRAASKPWLRCLRA
jgi:hypothetical protein